MQDIEFVAAFAGLLYGLALANVTNGFADNWRRRADVPVGILPCLIAVYIILGVAAAWMGLGTARDYLTLGPETVFTVFGITLPYIFVSRALTPLRPEQWESLEDYYLANRNQFLFVLPIPFFTLLVWNIVNYTGDLEFKAATAYFTHMGAFVVIPLALMGSRSIRVHRAGIVILIALVLLSIVQKTAS